MPEPLRRLIVTGDRNWMAIGVANRVLGSLVEKHGPTFAVVHGDADGVDAAFDLVASLLGLEVERHPADWKAFGRGAGPRRNQAMIDAGADFVVAVHRSLAWSKGTRDCCERALAAEIPTYLIESDEDRGRRIGEIPSREGARR